MLRVLVVGGEVRARHLYMERPDDGYRIVVRRPLFVSGRT